VEAVSQGGNGNVSVSQSVGATISVGERGIYARAAGSGSVVVNTLGVITATNRPSNSVAIDVVSESGSIAVSIGGGNQGGVGSVGNSGARGTALRTNSGGNVVITLASGDL